MIEFYHDYYIYIFPALRFTTLQRTYIIPNNSIRARSIFPFNPDLVHRVARGNVSRADHLSPPSLPRMKAKRNRSVAISSERKQKKKKNRRKEEKCWLNGVHEARGMRNGGP